LKLSLLICDIASYIEVGNSPNIVPNGQPFDSGSIILTITHGLRPPK